MAASSGASSSQTDQAVAAAGVIDVEAGQDIGFRRVTLDALENGRRLDRRCDLGDQTELGESRVGHDQRSHDPQSVQLGRQRSPRAETEENAIGKSEKRGSTVSRLVCVRGGLRQLGRSPALDCLAVMSLCLLPWPRIEVRLVRSLSSTPEINDRHRSARSHPGEFPIGHASD